MVLDSPVKVAALLLFSAAVLSFVPAWKHPAIAKARERPESNARQVRAGLVFDVGGRGDKSFNDAAFEGLVRAERELGVEIGYLEPRGSEDREAGLRLFAAQGFDIVIGVVIATVAVLLIS